MKLEKRSPIIAKVATNAPVPKLKATNGARPAVTTIEDTAPRAVFDRPNSGCPSRNRAPASNGIAKWEPNIFLIMTGVPLAMAKRKSACKIGIICILIRSCHVSLLAYMKQVFGCSISTVPRSSD